jgi:hypothetical protein
LESGVSDVPMDDQLQREVLRMRDKVVAMKSKKLQDMAQECESETETFKVSSRYVDVLAESVSSSNFSAVDALRSLVWLRIPQQQGNSDNDYGESSSGNGSSCSVEVDQIYFVRILKPVRIPPPVLPTAGRFEAQSGQSALLPPLPVFTATSSTEFHCVSKPAPGSLQDNNDSVYNACRKDFVSLLDHYTPEQVLHHEVSFTGTVAEVFIKTSDSSMMGQSNTGHGADKSLVTVDVLIISWTPASASAASESSGSIANQRCIVADTVLLLHLPDVPQPVLRALQAGWLRPGTHCEFQDVAILSLDKKHRIITGVRGDHTSISIRSSSSSINISSVALGENQMKTPAKRDRRGSIYNSSSNSVVKSANKGAVQKENKRSNSGTTVENAVINSDFNRKLEVRRLQECARFAALRKTDTCFSMFTSNHQQAGQSTMMMATRNDNSRHDGPAVTPVTMQLFCMKCKYDNAEVMLACPHCTKADGVDEATTIPPTATVTTLTESDANRAKSEAYANVYTVALVKACIDGTILVHQYMLMHRDMWTDAVSHVQTKDDDGHMDVDKMEGRVIFSLVKLSPERANTSKATAIPEGNYVRCAACKCIQSPDNITNIITKLM